MKTEEKIKKNDLMEIENLIGYSFREKRYLVQAFTRSSYRNEHPECPDNEVLELIGDSVLSLSVLTQSSERLLKRTSAGLRSEWNEGKLSSLKNALVNKRHLAKSLSPYGLEKFLLVSEGDRKTGVLTEDSVLEDLTESILGAVYVDSGYDFLTASRIAENLLHLSDSIDSAEERTVHISNRNDLQEWTQDPTRRYGIPTYKVEETEDGFHAVVRIEKLGIFADGYGKNGKIASENAALSMLERLKSPEMKKKLSNVPKKEEKAVNFIGKLNERLQKMGFPEAVYTVVSESVLEGNEHRFEVACECMGLRTVGAGENKQSARHAAAKVMLAKKELQ